jgi:hypothetical protein
MQKITIIILLLMTINLTKAQDFLYAVASEPTPVLNTPDFESVFGGADGMTVKTDDQGLIREMEFIALPGTVFDLLGELDYGKYKIFKVECKEYQYNTDLYIDSRFVELKMQRPKDRFISLPLKEEIYKSLDNAVGYRYCWGGNPLERDQRHTQRLDDVVDARQAPLELVGHLVSRRLVLGVDLLALARARVEHDRDVVRIHRLEHFDEKVREAERRGSVLPLRVDERTLDEREERAVDERVRVDQEEAGNGLGRDFHSAAHSVSDVTAEKDPGVPRPKPRDAREEVEWG